ncbi:hypothetical protein [Legionella impletisoli]|uniref:Uncharacterized protein n=1 Tax=Legionella impletisoli TaxID=343510 RepID=A0A917JM79_9GAMM|nr:hypothetical protein [Legionella impletisoli]GGI76520.1 hypothetical protein GCM10007966_01630 [Legionella impletisoli]
MKQYRPQILQIIKQLQQILTTIDHDQRKKIYSLCPALRLRYCENLGNKIAAAQTEEAFRLRQLKGIQPEEKSTLLENMNQANSLISHLEALLKCVTTSYRRGLNACQEHATLMSCILTLHFGINEGERVECVAIESASDPLCNHQFVVLGRKESSVLEDVSSWGEECLVVDSWGGWVEGIHNLPSGTGLRNFKDFGGYSGLTIKVSYDNTFYLNRLQHYAQSPEHPLHRIELITYTILKEHIASILGEFAETLNLPKLTPPIILSATPFGFYKDIATAYSPREPIDPRSIILEDRPRF